MIALLGFLLLLSPAPVRGAEPLFPFSSMSASPRDLNRGLEEKDLAFHPLPGKVYNEQKFFLCQCESGHMIMIGIYILKFGPIKKYGISLTVILPDFQRIFVQHLFDKDEFHVSTERCEVRAGNDTLKGAFPDYTLHIQDPKVTVTLSIHDLVPGWRPGNGRVYFGEERDRFYDFVMSNTRARVQGTLLLPDSPDPIPLKGFLYSDHCYVNLMPTDQAVNWYSLRAFGKELSVNYIEFVTPEKYGDQRVPWLLVTDNQQILYATGNVERKLFRYRKDPESGYEVPWHMELKVTDPGFRLDARVEAESVLDRFDVFSDLNRTLRFLAKTFFHRPIIFRFLSRYEIRVQLDEEADRPELQEQISGKGMSEVLFVK